MAKKYYWNGIGSITIKKKKYHAGDLLPADIEKLTLEKHLKNGEIKQQDFDIEANNALTENEQLKKEIESLKAEIEILKKGKAGK